MKHKLDIFYKLSEQVFKMESNTMFNDGDSNDFNQVEETIKQVSARFEEHLLRCENGSIQTSTIQ